MQYTRILFLAGALFASSSLYGAEKVKDPEADKLAAALTPRVFCRFVPERYDDFCFENNYIAMRVYGPALNAIEATGSGVDCWTKRVEYPICDKWYKLSLAGYSHHTDRGEGYDGYKVGESAGAGGSALWIDGKRVSFGTFTKWEILENTSEHCAFLLTYEKKIGGFAYKEEKKISLEMNTRLYTAESTFYKDGEIAAGLPVCVGVTSHAGAAIMSADVLSGWIACWEIMEDGSGLGTANLQVQAAQHFGSTGNGIRSARSRRGRFLKILQNTAPFF